MKTTQTNAHLFAFGGGGQTRPTTPNHQGTFRIAELWPPPPHDPRERVTLSSIGDWQVLAFALDSEKHRYFAPRGFLHLQLWHPGRRVSVLTPSRLTANRYEAFPIEDWKYASTELLEIVRRVRREHGVEVPAFTRIAALYRWHLTQIPMTEQ